MIDKRSCDICGLSETELRLEQISDTLPLQVDEDGLWICNVCQKRLTTKPPAQELTLNLDEKLVALVGKSAGAICRTLELPFVPPFDGVIEAASKIAYDQDRYMSAWAVRLTVARWHHRVACIRRACKCAGGPGWNCKHSNNQVNFCMNTKHSEKQGATFWLIKGNNFLISTSPTESP